MVEEVTDVVATTKVKTPEDAGKAPPGVQAIQEVPKQFNVEDLLDRIKALRQQESAPPLGGKEKVDEAPPTVSEAPELVVEVREATSEDVSEGEISVADQAMHYKDHLEEIRGRKKGALEDAVTGMVSMEDAQKIAKLGKRPEISSKPNAKPVQEFVTSMAESPSQRVEIAQFTNEALGAIGSVAVDIYQEARKFAKQKGYNDEEKALFLEAVDNTVFPNLLGKMTIGRGSVREDLIKRGEIYQAVKKGGQDQSILDHQPITELLINGDLDIEPQQLDLVINGALDAADALSTETIFKSDGILTSTFKSVTNKPFHTFIETKRIDPLTQLKDGPYRDQWRDLQAFAVVTGEIRDRLEGSDLPLHQQFNGESAVEYFSSVNLPELLGKPSGTEQRMMDEVQATTERAYSDYLRYRFEEDAFESTNRELPTGFSKIDYPGREKRKRWQAPEDINKLADHEQKVAKVDKIARDTAHDILEQYFAHDVHGKNTMQVLLTALRYSKLPREASEKLAAAGMTTLLRATTEIDTDGGERLAKTPLYQMVREASHLAIAIEKGSDRHVVTENSQSLATAIDTALRADTSFTEIDLKEQPFRYVPEIIREMRQQAEEADADEEDNSQ
jgi:hypothetical protein